jgi:hypothetical protein
MNNYDKILMILNIIFKFFSTIFNTLFIMGSKLKIKKTAIKINPFSSCDTPLKKFTLRLSTNKIA